MLYRLITENKNSAGIVGIVSTYFDGFTVYPATGYYKGKAESALIIEIDTLDKDQKDRILDIVLKIKRTNIQECVLVQRFDAYSELV